MPHDHNRDDKDREFEGRTYLYIRTHPSDTGAEPLPAGLPFWTSPDIVVIRPDGTPGSEAVADQENRIQVTVNNKGGITAVDAFVDAFFADPSTAFTPATATLIGSGYLTIPGYGAAQISLPWTPPASEAGHRCLLARVSLIFPPDTYVNPAVFDVVGDRHVAQRNIHVVALTGATKSLKFSFGIVNPLMETIDARVMAREIRNPAQVAQMRAGLGCGMAQFAQTPLREFGIALGEDRLLDPEVDRPAFRPGIDLRLPRTGVLPRVRMEAPKKALSVSLEPGEVRQAVLHVARNPDTRPGDLHAIEIVQVDRKKRLIGGLTVVVQH